VVIDLNGIPKVFAVFSLITKITNFVKIPLFIGYHFLFLYFTKRSPIRVLLSMVMPHNKSTINTRRNRVK